MKNKNLLIVFLKAPRPGEVKTRLQQKLGVAKTANLYRCLAEDLISAVASSPEYETRLMFWPPDAGAEIVAWLGESGERLPQASGDLGNKMHTAFTQAFADGYQRVVLIGSDIPTLSVPKLQAAFHRLDEVPLVIGPGEDGGYYLIGLRRAEERLFRDIPWSSREVLSLTLQRAVNAGLNCILLKPEPDIDEPADVEKLWRLMNSPTGADLRNRMPNLFTSLSELFSSSLKTTPL